MQFTNPTWLWALTGLAIPIGIHLLSRKEGKIISMGSLRFLTESPTAQFRHIRLNEIVLLSLRSLLIIFFVLILAGLNVSWLKPQKEKWVVIEKGVENSEWKKILDSLQDKGFEQHYLNIGFPVSWNESHENTTDYWSLVRDLQKEDLDSIIVVSYNSVPRFKGERINLPANIHWLTADTQDSTFIAMAIQTDEEKFWVRTGRTSPASTQYETATEMSRVTDSVKMQAVDTIDISLFASGEFEDDKKIILASLKAIQSLTPHRLNLTDGDSQGMINHEDGWIIWLSKDEMPESIKGQTIRYNRCEDNNTPLLLSGSEARLLCPNNKNSNWVIMKRVTQENALTENFTLQLATIILPRADEGKVADHRVLSSVLAWSNLNQPEQKNVTEERDDSMEIILISLLLTTLLSERLLAFKRNQ